jgi:hypothetical protein
MWQKPAKPDFLLRQKYTGDRSSLSLLAAVQITSVA